MSYIDTATGKTLTKKEWCFNNVKFLWMVAPNVRRWVDVKFAEEMVKRGIFSKV